MKPASTLPLAGVGILVTRPVHQSDNLTQRIRDLGGNPVLFPALQIEMLPQAFIDRERLADCDYAIFVSPNAARIGMDLIRAAGGVPAKLRLAAIGPATAAELGKAGSTNAGGREIITGPRGFDSDALLAVLPRELVAGRRIAVFRGEGGRELLGETLRERGGRVEYIECYRRVRPAGDMRGVVSRWQRGEIGASIATSAEIVTNLFAMAGAEGLRWLRDTPMFVPHPRVAAAAFQRGVQALVVAGAGDQALVAALETWFGRLRPEHALTPAT
ncbi:MAG TPA: uroporphyrinogen-III synthase [Burkholderiales bacterium]